MDYLKYFPFNKPRKEQIQCLDFSINQFNRDKKYVILECPVGVGKSAVAICLAKYLLSQNHENNCGTYIITTQKVLQTQYIKDFPDISNIWSASNYKCKHRVGVSCKHSEMLSKLSPDDMESEMCAGNCIYKSSRLNFFNNPIGVTNISYILNQITYVGIPKRELLVIDECHNLEQSIVDFVSIEFTQNKCEEIGILLPDFDTIQDLTHWVKKEYITTIFDQYNSHIKKAKKLHSNLKSKSDKKYRELLYLIKLIDEEDKHICKINRYLELYDPNNWVMTKFESSINVKPIHASKFSYSHLFKCADKILLMSGTILDHDTFCYNTGIPQEESAFISLNSPFPVENRPVFFIQSGSMSYKNIDKTLPKLTSNIKYILEEHNKDKGIIHCHTYKIANYIIQELKNNRLLIHDSKDRNEILEKHLCSDEPTVILSPSFTEGIDLYDNLSRFQIVCKIPFPFLGDNYIKTKMEQCQGWYQWMTVKTIIQALGRSVRNMDDNAISYILDSDWIFFYNQNKKMFPKWFRDSILTI